MLLIDDDQSEIVVRQEQRRAGADDDAHLPGGDRAPGPRAQALRQLRVPLGRAHAEALGETVEELRGQGDLGHEHQRLPPAPDDLADRLEIDLRLARAGDPVEQRNAIAAVGDGRHAAPSRPARCAEVKSGAEKSGSGARATGSGGSTRLSSEPSSTRPSMTPARPPPLRRRRFCRARGRRRGTRAPGRARPSSAWARGRRGARRRARARDRDARPCATPCAGRCRAQ